MTRMSRRLLLVFLALCCNGRLAHPARAATAEQDTGAAIIAADSTPENWLAHGRTYSEQRYSPLADINDKTIGRLHLAWHVDLDTNRGQEATPLVVDGVMYTTTSWSKLYAVDAASGKVLWEFDPHVDGRLAVRACCDVVNRGAAYWNGRVYIATIDDRLIAVDARSGKPVWSVDTIPHDAALGDQRAYTITGAPCVVKGKVLIGNGGAEFGTRGFLTAFDAGTGNVVWRFFTIPNPKNLPDHAASDDVLRSVAYKSWSPTGAWIRQGGGGTVWDSIVYDPVTDLVYAGVGNGSPWNYKLRSNGVGDNLFLGSIIALNPDTGHYVWHFQETPKDQWDYTSVQQIMTLDLPVDGQMRHVIVHAPKNGFFYILEAKTGKFLSGRNYVPVNWASGLDPQTGRPIMNPNAFYSLTGKAWNGMPGDLGGHNFPAMAFSPQTGLVYIPAQQTPMTYEPARKFVLRPDGWNLGLAEDANDVMPDKKSLEQDASKLKGWLIAWDPKTQKEAWRVSHNGPSNGGIVATAGHLLFQGLADGTFHAYDSRDGKELFKFDGQTGIVASPISYAVGGRQYIAIEVGWGGSYALFHGGPERAMSRVGNHSRILAFALDGTDSLPPAQDVVVTPVKPPAAFDRKQAHEGSILYGIYCVGCHGGNVQSGGTIPDLRWSSAITDPRTFNEIVACGALSNFGMDRFDGSMTAAQIEMIRQFIIERANQTYEAPAK